MPKNEIKHKTGAKLTMLDKSLPYVGLFMCREAGSPLTACPLPDGYSFAYFKDGDETAWARIEASVLEFDNEFSALKFFIERFMPYADELSHRCLFVENCEGEKVATATAWWGFTKGQRRPWLHWVAVDPQYQGLGLGKAIISRATELLSELEGDVDYYLHTQTWSHKAIVIYKKNSFMPSKEKALYKDRRDNYRRALRILRKYVKW